MPIHCPITFPRLSEDEMRTIDYKVMGHAFATHRELGRLCDESVYRRAILDCLGSETEPARILPMMSDGHPIGNQRFHLLSSETTLGVTTFSTPTAENVGEFQKLIAARPLRQMQWVNIALHQVTLCTIGNDRKSRQED